MTTTLTPLICPYARFLLGWGRSDLALAAGIDAAGIDAAAVFHYENGSGMFGGGRHPPRLPALMQDALKRAGIAFSRGAALNLGSVGAAKAHRADGWTPGQRYRGPQPGGVAAFSLLPVLNLRAKVTPANALLTWELPKGCPVASSQVIEISQDGGQIWGAVATVGFDATEYRLDGLEQWMIYNVRIRPRNSSGLGNPCPEIAFEVGSPVQMMAEPIAASVAAVPESKTGRKGR